LVNNEGVMSLSRAFVYAGCESTINSLWKADDRATSTILKQFHIYLQEGYSKSRALQQAKLDYIKSNALYKSPAYWAHLVLMGNMEPVYAKKQPYAWVAFILFSLCTFLRVTVRTKKN
jgi:CHAT domain-containing protein